MAQMSIAGYGRQYKTPVGSIIRKPAKSAVPAITRSNVEKAVSAPFDYLPDVFTQGEGGEKGTAFTGVSGVSAAEQRADNIMNDFMGYTGTGMAKKAASLARDVMVDPFQLGVPFASNVLNTTLGAINTTMHQDTLQSILSSDDEITDSNARSLMDRGTSVMDDIITTGTNPKTAASLNALGKKAAFDRDHELLGFLETTIYNPFKDAIKNVFGSQPSADVFDGKPVVNMASPINKGMGVLSGFGYADPVAQKTAPVNKPMAWNEDIDPVTGSLNRDADVKETIGRGTAAVSGTGKKGMAQDVSFESTVNKDPTMSNFSGTVGSGGKGGVGGTGVTEGGDEGSTPGTSPSPGGNGSVLCTELHRQGILSDELYASDNKYANTLATEIVRGYHVWAIPVAMKMRKSRAWTLAAKPFVMAWTQHSAYMVGDSDKKSMFGRMIEIVGVPICRLLNYLREYKNEKVVTI